ncbi:hydantoinase B/oxoprolinase family protein [Rouxiella badensis]|nr:hydantoinase B/oxoprolinase family protein [Rouxiella badensis]
MFEEGFLIPPSKLMLEGEVNQQLLDLLLANVRSPDQVEGDLHAMLAANQIGANGLLGLMDDLKLDSVEPLAEKIHSLTENAMRKAIEAVPDGRYEAAVDIGDYEGDIHLNVAVIVDGSNITIDYAGSSAESLFGSNCPMSFTYAYSVYPLKCLLEPHLPNNEGCFKSITVTAPVGSIANARPPCAVEMRNRVGHMAHAAIFTALSEIMPERVMGHSGSAPVTCDVFAGQFDDGRRFVESLCVNGGTGARPSADGIVTGFPGNMSSTPVELIESATPLLFTEKSIVPDSGGAGRYRGGVAQRMVIRNTSKFPLSHSMFYSRQKHPAQGVLGGEAGAPNFIAINGKQLEKPVGRHDVFPGMRSRFRCQAAAVKARLLNAAKRPFCLICRKATSPKKAHCATTASLSKNWQGAEHGFITRKSHHRYRCRQRDWQELGRAAGVARCEGGAGGAS